MQVIADNYQNSVDLSVEIHIDQVAPVRIYPAGDAISATSTSTPRFTARSQWITVTDDIFLWTPTPNAQVKFYETETDIDDHNPKDDPTWTCFDGCAGDVVNTANFTRDYSIVSTQQLVPSMLSLPSVR